MLIQKLQLTNFKRFTDLTIDLSGEEQTPKLVLLIGANGSGKSCVFDGFNIIASYSYLHRLESNNKNSAYYVKDKSILEKSKLEVIFPYKGEDARLVVETSENIKEASFYTELSLDNTISWQYVEKKDEKISDTLRKHSYILDSFKIYGRNAIKALPDLDLPVGTNFVDNVKKDLDRPNNTTERDERLKSNFAYLPYWLDIYAKEEQNQNLTFSQLKTRFYDQFTTSFNNVFAKNKNPLTFKEVKPNRDFNEADEFIFTKGNSEVEYKLLSMGEKLVVDIILDIIVRKPFYTDSIVYFDELDIHLHTDLQYDLMAEIMSLLGNLNSQVWVASHSLGFIQYATEYDRGAVIDLDNRDFDVRQTLVPRPNNNIDVYEIAVPKGMIFNIFNDKKLILCENQNDEYFNNLGLEKTLFVGQKDKETVIAQVKNQPLFFALIDKDYLTANEVKKLKKLQTNLLVLDYYSFENYLYHPDNLQEISNNGLLKNWNKQEYIQSLIDLKINKTIKIGESLNARKSYSLLKIDDLEKNTKEEKRLIMDCLQSNYFETFYPHFDIKHYGKPDLNLTQEQLTSTTWFKT